MTDDGNQKAQGPESEDSKNVTSMAKAFLVSVAWSYAEALERTKRSPTPQEPALESETKSETKSQTEPVDRDSESNQ